VSARQPERFLILVGPTAVGKTGVSIELARRLSGEIVSADSRLVYRMMDIGTAKPDERLRREIPHHMIDIADPDEDYTCKRFETEARQVIRNIAARGRTPIVVGGSGLYVRALTDGIFDGPGTDWDLRVRLRKEAESEGPAALGKQLNEVDPDKAARTDPQNINRVIRAIEVYQLAGRPMSELERAAKPFEIPGIKIGLSRDRRELYAMIDRRVEEMMEMGFLDEVRTLKEKGFAEARAVAGSLGYQELLDHLKGFITLERAVHTIKLKTRHFAKRQMTWFRKEPDITWIDITGCTDPAAYARLKKGTDPFFPKSSSPT
jgi:tRNA dimethylallyltransferase